MEFTKKMTLVLESLLENLQQTPKPQLLQPPSVRKVSELDGEIRHILEDPNLNDYEKAERYGQKLREFIFHKKRDIEPPTVYVKQQQQQGLSTEVQGKETTVKDKDPDTSVTQTRPSQVIADPLLKGDILTTVAKSLKNKAELLIEKLHQTLRGMIKGTVSLQGDVVHGSNITDLVNDLLRKRKSFIPIGWRDLGQALSSYNLPRDLIGNVDRYQYINNPRLTGTFTLR
ncbi:hypothetical protein SNE40_004683 [Patella caerulea]|uniref:Uncharacterized protein n=1 Tax=Patella caerulea TaxID=87958 RepID=A0AAN8K613_PATCE